MTTNVPNILLRPLSGGWLIARNNGGPKAAAIFHFLEAERLSGRTQLVSGAISGSGIRYSELEAFISRANAAGLTVQVGKV